ncbi:MAG: family 10 glycosylhydrolase [Phycisphaerae bacterium]|nr:family 10 glycosylhydrolase [Gemmatimonadaceae bacterium]
MPLRRFAFPFTLVTLLALAGCAAGSTGITTPVTPVPTGDTTPPPIPREMRGVWIATVANIDWPTRTGLTAMQQQAELIDLFDRANAAGLNAVMFHVRPAADAVYQSALEPWAAMLTGVQGQDPGFDPLAFAVREAHARGLELHAWINPFRAGNAKDTALLASSHLFRTRRALLRVYGSQLWLDPGEPAIHDHSINVVRDIVERYDVDGVHADDYFYPYQENDAAGRLIDFPDSGSYARSGSTLSRADWRRNNVDRFVERLYSEVHRVNPALKVGLSPFGIWRPGFPTGVNGLDAFASIYADSRKWLQQGWVDYLAPQLYWSIAAPQQSYPALFDWWLLQNPTGRHVWPGLAAYRVADGTASAFSTSEIPSQVTMTRARSGGTGHILYNANSTLKKSSGAVAASLSTLYASRALVPAYPWLDAVAPSAPTVTVSGRTMQMLPGPGEAPRWWVVRTRASATWSTKVVFGDLRTLALSQDIDRAVLTAVDQAGNVSSGAVWKAP